MMVMRNLKKLSYKRS